MIIGELIKVLEQVVPLYLQEDYDNAGLLTGRKDWQCSGALVSLDVTEEIVQEAVQKKCNLIIAHHPIVFRGLKKLNGNSYVERVLISALKNDIAIYAIHTNLDNIINGVNGKIADKLGLINRRILAPKSGMIRLLSVYVPGDHLANLETALFAAGAGHIGNYSECGFVTEGIGSFKPMEGANPYVGQVGSREIGKEAKLEVVYPVWQESAVLEAMKNAHPYEAIAYQTISLSNYYDKIGSGILGELPEAVPASQLLKGLQNVFSVGCIRHTKLVREQIKKVAICGGSGSFLTGMAIASGADIFITADVKYHEFFDADGKIILADIGHFESEQYTIELIYDIVRQNFPTFALLKTEQSTNPVHYFK